MSDQETVIKRFKPFVDRSSTKERSTNGYERALSGQNRSMTVPSTNERTDTSDQILAVRTACPNRSAPLRAAPW
jgi:hypothetical protein